MKTNEELRVMVSEELGWTDCKIIGNDRWFGIPPGEENRGDNYRLLHDYPLSLDACSELIDHLEKDGWSCVIVVEHGKRCCTFWRRGIEFKTIGDDLPRVVCESFLKTKRRL